MKLLHNIGPRMNSNYNAPEEILACDEPLSFDGVYLNVLQHSKVLAGKDVTLFVMGNHVGGNNSFDVEKHPHLRLEAYCKWDEIIGLCGFYGAKLGWHTWTHRDLTQLSDDEVLREVTPPFPMKWFAYPYGNWDARIAEIVKSAGFEAAWSVNQGDGSRFALRRSYLNW